MEEITRVFHHFTLTCEQLCIGERIKGGTFRPCMETIPSSTLKGAFRYFFGTDDSDYDNVFIGIGFFQAASYCKDVFRIAPFDSCMETAKLPITMEYLRPAPGMTAIVADVYMCDSAAMQTILEIFPTDIRIGGLKSKGFGDCHLEYGGRLDANHSKIVPGYLRGRLLLDERNAFGIESVMQAHPGYLFFPTSLSGGIYKPALFEGSIIKGPQFLVEKEYEYDYKKSF